MTTFSERRIGKGNPFYGRKHSKETLKIMSECKRGVLNPMHGISLHTKKPNYCRDCGKKITAVATLCRQCAGVERRGPNNANWRGGVSPIRNAMESRLWREAVFARDNWTCQECGKRGGALVSHHVKSYRDYPELRLAIDNGETLCQKCHKVTPNYCGRAFSNGN